jgi:hypothetical protein
MRRVIDQMPPPDRAQRDIDYKHRTTVNLVAAIALLIIALAVVWTFNALDQRRKTERCLASGRRDCVEIDASSRGPISLQR